MSEEASWNKDWWREARTLSLERKGGKTPASALAKPGDACLIVTEGTVTEPIYFTLLRSALQLSGVHIKVTPGDHTDPRQVIRTADTLRNEQLRKGRQGLLAMNEPAKFDHVWAVIDTDVAVRDHIWNEVRQLANAKKVKLAHSTPCFEFWLLLHITGFTTRSDLHNGDAAKSAVSKSLGQDYSTNEETAKAAIASFLAKWPDAVLHAENVRRHHLTASTPPPANPSTEVDRLVRTLNDSAQVRRRKL
jgi:hypothetical protein